MRDLLQGIKDRLESKMGRPHTSPALDAKRVTVVVDGDVPLETPPPPWLEVKGMGRPPRRYASQLRETVNRVVVTARTKINVTRDSRSLGAAGAKRYTPATGPLELCDQVRDILDQWWPTDGDGTVLGYEHMQVVDITPVTVTEQKRAASASASVVFEVVKFETIGVPS